jgi:Helicase HerA, central domain
MKTQLEIGQLMSGAAFALPFDFVTRKLAIIAMSGAGKTVAATDIAEEMCEAGMPWVALDPVGVWWGLRSKPDGTPGGYPVVVVGGQHGDLPLDPTSGAKIAEAWLQEHWCLIVDLKRESKNAWRRFVADFCDRLMDLNPAVPRHVFLEESPEFVPQKPMGEQKRSLAAVDRLVRLGRNNGYGITLISQRFATIQKDVLTQCENLLALRCIGKTDRDACADWIGEVVHDSESAKTATKFFQSLSALPDGQGWFWSPQWLKQFVQVRMRRRKTLHPGDTRTLGQAPVQVQLADVQEFVDRFSKLLAVPKQEKRAARAQLDVLGGPDHLGPSPEVLRLTEELRAAKARLAAQSKIISELRYQMEPEYRKLQALFADLDAVPSNGASAANTGLYDVWKQKLGQGCAKIIDAILERGPMNKPALITWTGLSRETVRIYTSKMIAGNLMRKDGDLYRLNDV